MGSEIHPRFPAMFSRGLDIRGAPQQPTHKKFLEGGVSKKIYKKIYKKLYLAID